MTDSVVNFVLTNPASLAVLAAILGIGSYTYQSYRNRKANEHERKLTLYERLIKDVFKLLSARPGPDASEVITEFEKSWLFASDDVLLACYQVMRIYGREADPSDPGSGITASANARKEFAEHVASLFVAMRRDLISGRRTKIDEAWAKKTIEIYEWGAPFRYVTQPEGIDQTDDQ